MFVVIILLNFRVFVSSTTKRFLNISTINLFLVISCSFTYLKIHIHVSQLLYLPIAYLVVYYCADGYSLGDQLSIPKYVHVQNSMLAVFSVWEQIFSKVSCGNDPRNQYSFKRLLTYTLGVLIDLVSNYWLHLPTKRSLKQEVI